jgi:hypothetical protein
MRDMTTTSVTHYVRDADMAIAYKVSGASGPDLLYVPTATHPVDLMWDDPVIARGLHRLSTTFRLVTCDLIGVGSCDPVLLTTVPAVQAGADGLGAVLGASRAGRTRTSAPRHSSGPALRTGSAGSAGLLGADRVRARRDRARVPTYWARRRRSLSSAPPRTT